MCRLPTFSFWVKFRDHGAAMEDARSRLLNRAIEAAGGYIALQIDVACRLPPGMAHDIARERLRVLKEYRRILADIRERWDCARRFTNSPALKLVHSREPAT